MKRRIPVWLAALLLLWAAAFCARAESAAPITSREQLNQESMTIGVSTGTISETTVMNELPKAKIAYYNDNFLGYADVASGKIDAFVYDLRQMKLAVQNGLPGVLLLEETMEQRNQIAVGLSDISPIPDLADKTNRFIAEMKESGILAEMFTRWVTNGSEEMPDIQLPENPEYHLRVGTTGIVPPYSYYQGQNLAGYDIELARRFAAWLGADLQFSVMDYGAVAPALKGGRVDVVMANLQITPARAENFRFSDPLYEEVQGILVRKGDGAAETETRNPSFWDGIADSFSKTFIREERWKLFTEGIGVTLLITVLSILFGTALGFVTFMLCRNGNPIANGITRVCTWLVQGMPMVVLLMVLYYIVFGSVSISGVAVSVIGFTLTFGSAVYAMVKTGVGTIDPGQFEAACALGHTGRQAFFRVILPQALPRVMPAYRGEIIGLIKATAIVGYIAVMDLTKMGDIVRSRTYEAFFPLIAVTVIYFVLEGLFILLVGRISRRLDPKRRGRETSLLKGVKIHD